MFAALPPALLSANTSGLSPARMRLPPQCVPSFAIVSPRFFNTPFEPVFFLRVPHRRSSSGTVLEILPPPSPVMNKNFALHRKPNKLYYF